MRTPRTAHPSLRALGSGAAAAVLALGLVACGSDDSDDSSADSPDSSDTSTSASEDPSAGSDESDDPGSGSGDVELLDAGSGDMQVLELDLEEGQTETTTITTRIGGGQASGATPPITVILESEVTSADDDGYEVTQEFTDIRAQGAGAAGSKALAGLKGLQVELDLTRQGEVTDTEVDVPDSAPQQLQQLGDQLAESASNGSVAFPSEEVGEGARWRVSTETETGAATAEQTATFTLTSLDGDDYEVAVDLEQDISGAGTTGSGTGSGMSRGSLTQLLPQRADTTLRLEIAGQSATAQTRIDSQVD